MNILKKFVSLKKSLEQERAELQTRLQEIEAALGGNVIPVSLEESEAPKATTTAAKFISELVGKPKRKVSAAGRKAIAAAAKARWARAKAAKAGEVVVAPKKHFSAAARARLAAAAKARWARAKATGKSRL